MNSQRALLVLLAALGLTCLGPHRLQAEPKPEEYDVRIHYRIDAYRNQRLPQFRAMLAYFQSLGFHEAPGPDNEAEDPSVILMTGTIPAATARQLLAERHVKALVLSPHGSPLPTATDPVRVHLELTSFLTPEQHLLLSGREAAPTARRSALEGVIPDDLAAALAAQEQQRLFQDQVRVVLRDLGFREAVGYDERHHTRLVGMIPAGKVDVLLTDLRLQPAGVDLPAPFRSAWPLRVTEVMLLLPFPVERPLPVPPPKGQEQIAPELRTLLANEAEAAKPVHMEVSLSYTPEADDPDWQRRLTAVANVAVEGRLGPLVAVQGAAREALRLATAPYVSTVRLPRSGEPRLPPDPGSDARALLRDTGLERLQTLGGHGRGSRLAIIDGDFRGWQGLVTARKLPAGTRYLDLTAERNRSLLPDDFPGEAQGVGYGSRCAVAAALAAPAAELLLIRIDPAAPYMLQEVAQYINGDSVRSPSLEQRYTELREDEGDLERRGAELRHEREALLREGIPLVPDLDRKLSEYGLDPKLDKRWIDRQQAWVKAQAQYEQDQQDYQDRMRRYANLLRDFRGLRGTHAVASSLLWNEGYPVNGSSALSRYFDDRPFRAAVWFQVLSTPPSQSWSGLFRDVDGNEVMEFAPPTRPLPQGRWNRELNFLAWTPAGKEQQTTELPAGARLRIAVQWREAHDADFWRHGEDPYRPPLANLNVVLLRQLDPEGAKRPVDDMEVVAQSVSLPQRLDNQPNAATYEQTVEFTVAEAGRYAVRVEGRVPAGIRPAGEPTLPALLKSMEVYPRVFVETLEGAGAARFEDYVPKTDSVGMPADAHQVVPVGPGNESSRPQPNGNGPHMP